MERSEHEQRVETYLNEIKFKKRALGGIDEEDVLEKIEELCGLIHEHYKIEIIKARAISREADRNEVQTLRNEVQALRSKAQALINENKSVRAELKAAQERLREAESERDRLRESGGPLEREQGGLLDSLRAELDSERNIRASVEAGLLKYEHDSKYRELVEAINTVEEMKNEAAKARVEAVQEASKLRSEILEKVREERRKAEIGVRQLQSEIAILQRKREEIQEMIGAQQGVLSQSVDNILLQLQEIRGRTDTHIDTVPLTDIIDDPV